MSRGTGRRRRIAVAATASGGETMAPSVNATAQSRPGMAAWTTTVTTTVVATTRPIASDRIGRAWARKSRTDVKKAEM